MKLSLDNIKNLLIIILIVILILLGYGYFVQNGKYRKDKLNSENLTKALTDTVHHFKNKQGQWEYEKRTIQTTVGELSKFNEQLTLSQKELLERIKESEKNNKLISAALLDIGVKVNNLTNEKPSIIDSTSVTFEDKNDSSFKYNLTVFNVKPIDLKIPKLTFNNLEFPNKQYIEFNWKTDKNGKKEGYPVSFSVTNTNPFYKVYNVDSYIIPEIEKEKLKPTFWNKLENFSKTTGGKILFFSLGFGTGVVIVK